MSKNKEKNQLRTHLSQLFKKPNFDLSSSPSPKGNFLNLTQRIISQKQLYTDNNHSTPESLQNRINFKCLTTPSKFQTSSQQFCLQKRKGSLDAKIIPQSFTQDKETLYDGLIQVKKANNILKDELTNLRTSNQFYQEELTKLNQTINSIGLQDLGYNVNYSDIVQISSLKKQITHLQDQLNHKQLSFSQLQTCLTQLMRNSDVNILSQDKTQILITTLQQDNIELTALIKSKETQIFDQDKILQKCKVQLNRVYNQYQIQRQLVQERDKDISLFKKKEIYKNETELKTHPIDLKVTKQLTLIEIEFKKVNILYGETQRNVIQLRRNITNLNNEIRDKDQMNEKEVLYLKDQIVQLQNSDFTRKFNEKTKSSQPRKTVMLQNAMGSGLQRSTSQNFEYDSDIKTSDNLVQNKQDHTIDELEESDVEEESIDVVEEQIIPFMQQNGNKIQKHHFQHTAILLKYKLRSLNIDLSDIDCYLFSAQNLSTGFMKLSEFYPFEISDQEQNSYICQYILDDELIKENDGKKSQGNVQRVRSIFKTIVENYKIISNEQRTQIEYILHKSLTKHRNILCDLMNRNKGEAQMFKMQEQIFLVKDLLNGINEYELPFQPAHIDHLMQTLYEISNDKNIIEFNGNQLFTIFERSESILNQD